MKMKKRFLGILLSLVMVLGLMPGMTLAAYANSGTEENPWQIGKTTEDNVTAWLTETPGQVQ